MHTQKYTKEFKEQALVKVYSRQTRTIESIAEELNLPKNTLKMWIKKAAENMPLDNSTRPPAQSRRTEDWTAEERLVALQQSYQLTGEVLHNWCRERGIYAHHLTQWKADFCAVNKTKTEQQNTQEFRALKQAHTLLQRDLNRKEKALAEAAALLVLQKKFNALWADEEK